MATNFEMMRKRLEFQGGIAQEDRMIKDKFKTFLKALSYSYQGCWVQKIQNYSSCEQLEGQEQKRALINPDKNKPDYDDKILSIDYANLYEPGDIFKWVGTNTHWIIYSEELTEDAYFRGEIRRCKYKIKFKDKNGEVKETWAAIRGPVETTIESIQKNQVRINTPNLSLNILLPKNEDTLEAFDRYDKFLFQGKAWRVEAPDSISIRNVIELAAEEYYIDRDTDDVEQEIIDGLVIEPEDPNTNNDIIGATFIKPKISEVYEVEEEGGTWMIKESTYPVCLKLISDTKVQVLWQKTTSGQFTLQWVKGDATLEKIIVVESLF